ncbi:hypothetical protein HWD35_18995 [Tsukamurella tyrosinosolvens]|uniref:hypothetical protein n=1 Tax=Tsukamurella tyrosinosolvens TaxID=57704 RepID=UPI001CE113A1|nr:hypothetical protein [Tsukamurella tyrosinosolvens]MCA4996807.1 hypothetical protein [Tsukamurella tyrosinosolvens]
MATSSNAKKLDRGGETGDLRPRLVRMAKRTLTLLIAVLAAILSVLWLPLNNFRDGAVLSISIAVGLLLLIASGLRILSARSRSGYRAAMEKVHKLPSKDADSSRSRTAVAEFLRHFDIEDATRYMMDTSDLPRIVVRGTETVDLAATDYRTKVVWTVTPGDADNDSKRLLLPVVTTDRGQLIDNLHLESSSGPIRFLSHREVQGMHLLIGKSLIKQVTEGSEFPKRFWERIRRQILTNRGAEESDVGILLEELETLARRSNYTDPRQQMLLGLLTQFVSDVCDSARLVCCTTRSDFVEITAEYSQSKRAIRATNGRKISRMWDESAGMVRAVFGLAQRTHVIAAKSASAAQGYHLVARAPEGMYVYELSPEIWTTESEYEGWFHPADGARAIDPAWTASNSLGGDYIHAYGRDLDFVAREANGNLPIRIPVIRVELRETPPGLIFPVFLMAIYLAVLLVGMSYWHDRIFGFSPSVAKCIQEAVRAGVEIRCPDQGPGDIKTYLPTMLLTIPAIVSAWLLNRCTPDAIRRASISTIAVIVWNLINVVCSVTLAVLKMTVLMAERWTILGITVTQPLWLLMLLSAMSCAIVCCLLLFFRVRRYRMSCTLDNVTERL